MEKIRICIGSNDKENIAGSHMGDTEQFFIFDLFKNGESVLIESRNNDARELDHSASDKMSQILKIVKDAEILIAWQKSPNFINIAKKTKYQPVIVKEKKIDDVLKTLQNSFSELKGLVEKRARGTFSDEIPEYS
ncbi:MAG: NifB/NifX family molybdenum-iron cluster-binding protein [Acidobacteriota bacterium]